MYFVHQFGYGVRRSELGDAMAQIEDMAALPDHPVMKKWWAHMADIMATNPDNSPVSVDLKPVFHMS